MMTKIGNMQKIMISLDIFAEQKLFLNWPKNLPLKYQALVSTPCIIYIVYIYYIQFRYMHINCDTVAIIEKKKLKRLIRIQ